MLISTISKMRTAIALLACGLLPLLAGCGTTKTRSATEQLLMSDAVDRTIAQIDFIMLKGQTVYFDTTYIKNVKSLGFVNADYVISSLRQQMLAAGCMLQEAKEDADFVIEGRVGALGTDGQEIVYGIPANNSLTSAATLLPGVPMMPALPEIALAKKEDLLGAAKIAVFAYHRETRESVWQSGVTVSTSDAKDAWVFGAGPFQYGSIYNGTRFAGTRLPFLGRRRSPPPNPELTESYYHQLTFHDPNRPGSFESPGERWNREIDGLAQMPELFSITEDLLEPPRRLPRAERIAERPEPPTPLTTSAATGEANTSSTDDAPAPSSAEPASAADPPAAPAGPPAAPAGPATAPADPPAAPADPASTDQAEAASTDPATPPEAPTGTSETTILR